jgi:hypothetical protein
MQKMIVLDNVFDPAIVEQLKAFDYGPPMPQRWYDYGVSPLHEKILEIAKEHFDLSQTTGYEMWVNQKAVGWHFDHDEYIYKRTEELIFPAVSIVYYAHIENMQGGDFTSESFRCTPKTNRLVMFSSDIYHAVYDYTGTRFAISMNPWNNRPV